MGTITGVTAGTGLAGGGSSGNVTVNLAANACPAGTALSALPFACSPFAGQGANNFLGNQNVTGTVTATAFSGNGAGLTGVSAATAATASNALALGGNAPSFYATTGTNTFTGGQSMPSVSVSGATATGSITVGGGTPITQYISVTQPITLPSIRAGQCTTFETAALTGFTPGSSDSIALGIPSVFLTGLEDRSHGVPPPVFLVFQAWETSSSPGTTITLQVCNPSSNYGGGAAGTVRIDVFKH